MIAIHETVEISALFKIELEKAQRDLVVLALNRLADDSYFGPYVRRQVERLANQAIQSREITFGISEQAAITMGLMVPGDDPGDCDLGEAHSVAIDGRASAPHTLTLSDGR